MIDYAHGLAIDCGWNPLQRATAQKLSAMLLLFIFATSRRYSGFFQVPIRTIILGGFYFDQASLRKRFPTGQFWILFALFVTWRFSQVH